MQVVFYFNRFFCFYFGGRGVKWHFEDEVEKPPSCSAELRSGTCCRH